MLRWKGGIRTSDCGLVLVSFLKRRKRGAKAEFEAIMSRAMAWRTWSAAPLRLAHNPHPGIGRIHGLRHQLGVDKTFASAYILDGIQPICHDEVSIAYF